MRAAAGGGRVRAAGGPVLEVDRLIQRYSVPGGQLEAVSDVSFTIGRGATLGLVGESGSGESSIGRAVIQPPPPTPGPGQFDGRELTTLSKAAPRAARSGIQTSFQ